MIKKNTILRDLWRGLGFRFRVPAWYNPRLLDSIIVIIIRLLYYLVFCFVDSR